MPNLHGVALLSYMSVELALNARATPSSQDDILPSTTEEPLAITNELESKLYGVRAKSDGRARRESRPIEKGTPRKRLRGETRLRLLLTLSRIGVWANVGQVRDELSKHHNQ